MFEGKLGDNSYGPFAAVLEGLDYLACLTSDQNFAKIQDGFSRWTATSGDGSARRFRSVRPTSGGQTRGHRSGPDGYYDLYSRSERGTGWQSFALLDPSSSPTVTPVRRVGLHLRGRDVGYGLRSGRVQPADDPGVAVAAGSSRDVVATDEGLLAEHRRVESDGFTFPLRHPFSFLVGPVADPGDRPGAPVRIDRAELDRSDQVRVTPTRCARLEPGDDRFDLDGLLPLEPVADSLADTSTVRRVASRLTPPSPRRSATRGTGPCPR